MKFYDLQQMLAGSSYISNREFLTQQVEKIKQQIEVLESQINTQLEKNTNKYMSFFKEIEKC